MKNVCYAKGLCELHPHALNFVLSPGPRPQACPLVHLQAAQGDFVVNRRHEGVILDSFERHLVPLLDGTNDRDSLVENLITLALRRTLAITVEDRRIDDRGELLAIMAKQLDAKLLQLSRKALIVDRGRPNR